MLEKDTCGFRPTTTLLHSSLRPSNFQEIASIHRDQCAHGGQTINASFEEFKGKDTFFVSEWFGKKA